MAEDNGSKPGGGAQDLLQSLMSKEVVIPAVATAATVVAYAARKGTSEAKDKLEGEAEKLGEEGAEGAKKGMKSGGGGALGSLASKAFGGGGGSGGGGGGGDGAKKTRRLPIQRYTDIAAPVGTVYEKWTEFEEFPNFMHRVLNVKQEDDKVTWDEKIWFSSRRWEGEITERKRNKRIAWKTTSGMAHAGVVTFHKLDDELTRVMVDMDFVPQGMIEKMASGLRFVKRAVQADLARFKAYVELGQAEDLEYHSKPAEREGEGEKDKKDEKDEKGDEPRGESNGSGDESRERESAASSS
jgi:Polyketide cyclase / dehydrase and lipid transport